jgi:hypothetical protein
MKTSGAMPTLVVGVCELSIKSCMATQAWPWHPLNEAIVFKEKIMSVQEWEIVVGVVTAAILATGPWMFMVHAKLAVLSTQVGRLETKVDRMVDADQERLPQCIQHDAALKELERRWEMHALQIENISDRLQDV